MLHQPGIEPGSVQYDSTTRPPVLLVLAFIMTIYLRTGYPFSILPPCAENPRYREREREKDREEKLERQRNGEFCNFKALNPALSSIFPFFSFDPLQIFGYSR